jgi:pimeloyl-ACP methyl ester carboxylesterase
LTGQPGRSISRAAAARSISWLRSAGRNRLPLLRGLEGRGTICGAVLGLVAILVVAATDDGPARASAEAEVNSNRVRSLTIHYRAHSGKRRAATVVLPAWYGPKNNPHIPLVISPHGRGVSGRANARVWGRLPAYGSFAVVSPDGQGRRLRRHSWGYSGQIEDLARMPVILHRTLPWLRIDRRRIYAIGGSMGGQETLLLLARYPRLLAGAAVFDAVVDLKLQYRRFRLLGCNRSCRRRWTEPLGDGLRELARHEIGGPPKKRPMAYRVRSPLTYARSIAFSCVPLQIWWSDADRVVTAPRRQSERLFRRILALNPDAPVWAYVGFWRHTVAMQARSQLPIALVDLGFVVEPFQPSRPRLRRMNAAAAYQWCDTPR